MKVRARLVVLCLVVSSPAAAQLHTRIVTSGLQMPVAFVQDPSRADVQYIVEQAGRIRVLEAGHLHATPFLDIRSVVRNSGEQGLLGLVFSPTYGSDRRFFINFVNLQGHTVIARFLRSSTSALQADPTSRFDLMWPSGLRYIEQPYTNHKGGDLHFGDDGRLYIGMGDGGSGNDPEHRAQDPSTLLGKMLRIDVNVGDADPEGYDIPPDNPFLGRMGYLAEIWSFGLRNPWRFSFDSAAHGGTGALVIGDVGQNRYEEINYEPAGRGGRNYGWRLREGLHANVETLPAAFLPLTDPIHEYDRSFGQSVTGGVVYRGRELPATYAGRYFFADFVSGRVWSARLNVQPDGTATVAAIEEHTAALGGDALGNISSFGVDANGEMHLVSYDGVIRRITTAPLVSQIVMHMDLPGAGIRVQPFSVAGWAIDRGETRSGAGVSAVHVWAHPLTGSGSPTFLGASGGLDRPDIGALFGPEFRMSGYSVPVSGLAEGPYLLVAYMFSTVTARFEAADVTAVHVSASPMMSIDLPAPDATRSGAFAMTGWAVDTSSTSGTGVGTVHVWAYPESGGPVFVGAAGLGGQRPDIASLFGPRFAPSGWGVTVSGLPPGRWTLVAYVYSTVTGTFRLARTVTVTVSGAAER